MGFVDVAVGFNSIVGVREVVYGSELERLLDHSQLGEVEGRERLLRDCDTVALFADFERSSVSLCECVTRLELVVDKPNEADGVVLVLVLRAMIQHDNFPSVVRWTHW